MVVSSEVHRYLPFLAFYYYYDEAVKAGTGREDAHAAIKEHAVKTVNDLRQGKSKENDLIDRRPMTNVSV